jgi:hypothetical protein
VPRSRRTSTQRRCSTCSRQRAWRLRAGIRQIRTDRQQLLIFHAGLEALSNELMNDSIPLMLDVVARSLLRSVALKFDLAVWRGSGTPPEPRGLRVTANVNTVSLGTNGGALTKTSRVPHR